MPEVATISYQSPATAERKRAFRRFYTAFLLPTAMVAAGMILFLLFFASYAREIFVSFKTDLPVLTEWTFALERYMRNGLWLAVVPVVFVIPLFPALLTTRQESMRRATLAAILYLLCLFFATLFYIVWMVLALFLPMVKLVQSVSGST